MALTTGVQAASATPATDQLGIIDTCLTAAGWTQLTDMSAATAGTTAAVAVFISPATTGPDGSGVYDGMVLYIEYDDANVRLRFRLSEQYDSDATGTPASRVKFPVPGNTTSMTPTASNSAVSDSFLALYQAPGTTATVGWVNIPVAAGGHNYWVGANDTCLFYMNNVGGFRGYQQNTHFVIAAKPTWQGTTQSAQGGKLVSLTGRAQSTDDDWGNSCGSSSAWPTRFSRDPGVTTARSIAFAYRGHSRLVAGENAYVFQAAAGTVSSFYSNRWVAPLWLHGATAASLTTGECQAATLDGFYVDEGGTSTNALGNIIGEEVNASGVTLTTVGMLCSAVTNGVAQTHLYVDGSIF